MLVKKFKQIFYKRLKKNEMANQSVKESFASQGFIPMNDFQEKDIFIAGYPKSGNTWLQNIITGLLIDSTSQLLTPKLINEIIPDIHVKKYFKRFFNVMIFKTHDLPKPEYKKVIHLVRDGRDVMVSYYHMGKNKISIFTFWMSSPSKLEKLTVD